MKKSLWIIIAFIMATVNMNAQTAKDLNFQFRVGANLSTLTGNDDAKMKLGYSIGAGMDYCLTDQFALRFDLSHDYIGAKSKLLDENLNLEYLSFGPMAKYYATPWLAFQAGPELGFLLKAKVDDTSYKSHYKDTEFSLPIGVSFEPKVGKNGISLIFDLRYRLGLTKANKDGEFGKDFRNSAIILTVGYKYSM
jgi:hypothetical protein